MSVPGLSLDNANVRIAHLEAEVDRLRRAVAAHRADSVNAFVIVGKRLGDLEHNTESLRAVANDHQTWAEVFSFDYFQNHPNLVAVMCPDPLPDGFEIKGRAGDVASAKTDLAELREKRRLENESDRLRDRLTDAEATRDAYSDEKLQMRHRIQQLEAELKAAQSKPTKKKPAAKK